MKLKSIAIIAMTCFPALANARLLDAGKKLVCTGSYLDTATSTSNDYRSETVTIENVERLPGLYPPVGSR